MFNTTMWHFHMPTMSQGHHMVGQVRLFPHLLCSSATLWRNSSPLCASAIFQHCHRVWASSFTGLFQHLPMTSQGGLFVCLLSAKSSATVWQHSHAYSQLVLSPSAPLGVGVGAFCFTCSKACGVVALPQSAWAHLFTPMTQHDTLLPGGCLGTFVHMSDTTWKYRHTCFFNCLSQECYVAM